MAAEGDGDAAGEDRIRQGLGLLGGEEEEGVVRRFLKGLEEAVGGLGGHAVGIEEDGDFAAAEEGAHLELLFEGAGLLDAEAAGFRFGLGGVDIRVIEAGGGIGHQAGELGGELALPAAARAGEEVGMGEPAAARGRGSGAEGIGDGEGH